MSDDIAAPVTDTADVSAPPEGHAQTQEQVDYEKRYNDLRSEFDRRNQTLSEYEQTISGLSDPDTRAEILAQYGLELEDDEDLDTPEYVDPVEQLQARLDALEAEKQESQQAAEYQAWQDAVSDYIIDKTDEIEATLGYKLDKDERKILATRAQQLQADNNADAPMVQEAWEALTGLYDKAQQRGKARPSGRPVAGQSASKQPDLSNERERADYIDSRLNANE